MRWRHLPEIAEGMGDHAAAIFGERAQLLHSSAKLLSLRRAETLNRFVALDQTATLVGRHVVELRETIAQMLLGLRRKLAKAGFILERALLLGKRHVAVAAHPLAEVLLTLRPLLLSTPLVAELLPWTCTETASAVRASSLPRECRRGGREHENNQC